MDKIEDLRNSYNELSQSHEDDSDFLRALSVEMEMVGDGGVYEVLRKGDTRPTVVCAGLCDWGF